ncbi:ABC transporter ATP-binding protein [Streptomyces europaeiscabiei]|uniref:ABC transporter ATP-binding protein n=1 Tax=Streptomyces europaeiscabiei TaxID=146819 RepID=UPI002E143607|nr:ATP-binding cassette domain-containing protein [Streptomyces europaeiscabiei]
MKQYDDGTGRAAPASLAEITDLRVEVGGRAIVDGVSLRVLPGRVTALVGASGSGKTTTGLALLGEFPQDARVSGDVHVAAAGRVGYVPQHPAAVLNPARRITALLTDIARTQVRHLPRGARRAASREHVLRALADAQLPDAAHLLRRYPHQLSGGQQQRVVLAQALLLGARVIVADEPTTGQDALTKSLIVEQLAAVAARGIAVVLLSHDLDVVRALADEVHVMRAGRVVESGPTERVWEAPRHEWTRQLLLARTSFTETAMKAEVDSEVNAGMDAGMEATTAVGTSTGSHDRGARAATVPVLRVRHLTARHRDGSRGAKVTVRAPDLVLHAGELLAVVGRSGSGKTTLARCLAGLHRDHDGDILLDGTPLPRSLRDRGRGQLAAVQYVFQDARAAFDEHRPVVRQVARTAVRLRGVDDRTAEAEALTTLTRLGLAPELVGRHPARLSGGELQRAALARALLARPRVLICDEITSGLDTVTRRGILDVLTGLIGDGEGTGPALVLITHDLDTAAVAHRIAVMDAGELVEQGPARQVLTAPQHAFTASLISTTRWSARAPH